MKRQSPSPVLRGLRAMLACLIVLVAAIALVPVGAQNAAKRAMDLEDILAFRALGTTALSKNGQWFAYRLSPLQGDSEVIIRGTSSDKEMKFPVGEGAGGAVAFSDDSAWAAITISPTRKDAQANTRARRPNQTSVTIVNLATGDKVTVPKIRRFAFSGELAGWIAMHRYGPEPAGAAASAAAAGAGRGGRGGGAGASADAPRDTRPRGTDLILRELKTGAELSVGNVSEFAFNKNGRYLALVIDAADQIGNGLQIRDMQSGAIMPLDTSTSFYERMAWAEEGDALALLKGKDDRQYRERLFSVVGFTGFGASGAPKKTTFDPGEDKAFPAGMSVSGNRQPQWTESRDALIFGIAALTKAPPRAGAGGRGAGAAAEGDAPEGGGRGANAGAAGDDNNNERPNLVIWHYKDPRLQSQQEVQETRDRQANYVTMYRPDEKKLVRLADDEVADIVVTGRGRWAVGTSDDPYELQGNLDGQRFLDVYAVDTKTGQKKVIKKKLRWGNSRLARRQQVPLLRETSTSTCSTWRAARRAT